MLLHIAIDLLALFYSVSNYFSINILFFYSDDPVVWNGTTLYFRGFRILNAIIDELLTLGGDNMEDIIFTGCSGHIHYYNSHSHSHAYCM